MGFGHANDQTPFLFCNYSGGCRELPWPQPVTTVQECSISVQAGLTVQIARYETSEMGCS